MLHARSDCDWPSSELACDDDGGSYLQSVLETPVEAGDTVYLAVDAYRASATGSFELHVSVE